MNNINKIIHEIERKFGKSLWKSLPMINETTETLTGKINFKNKGIRK